MIIANMNSNLKSILCSMLSSILKYFSSSVIPAIFTFFVMLLFIQIIAMIEVTNSVKSVNKETVGNV